MSNGSKTHSIFRPVRNGSTEYTLPSTETVAVLRTCRITLHENASFSSAGSASRGWPAASRACGASPVSECGRAWYSARSQELLLDSLEYPFYLAAAHRPPGLAVGQLDAEHRARPLQRRIDKSRSVIGVERPRNAVRGDRGAQHPEIG